MGNAMAAEQQTDRQKLYGIIFMMALAVVPFIALLAPRFLAYWPGIAGLPALIAFPFVFGVRPQIPWKAVIVVGAVMILAGLSILWALDPAISSERMGKMALILLPGLALSSVAASVPLSVIKPYGRYILYAVLAATGLTVLDMLANFPLYRLLHGYSFAERVHGSDLNRGVIALLALLFIVLPVANKKLTGVLAAVFCAMIVLTTSQSAQLGFLLALICYFFFPYSRKWAWGLVAFLLAAGTMAAPFLAHWLFSQFAADITTMPFLGSGRGYGAQRLEIWDSVGRYALQNPWYGFGLEATRAVEAFDTAQLYRNGVTELHPHNFAIQLWIEFGLIGALAGSAFFAFLIKGFSGLQWAQARIALPCFMILLTVASFGYGLWQSWFLGLFMLSLAMIIMAVRFSDGGQKDNKEHDNE